MLLLFRKQRYSFSQYKNHFLKYFLLSIFNLYLQFNKTLIMDKMKVGRKPIANADKVKLCSAYLKDNEKKAINKAYGSLTIAVRTLILPTLKIN